MSYFKVLKEFSVPATREDEAKAMKGEACKQKKLKVGDRVDRLPLSSAPWLIADGFVEEVTGDKVRKQRRSVSAD